VWEFSSGYVDDELERTPQTIACTGAVLQTKVETKDGLYWFENHIALI
jgi:hypothetical protein